MGVHDDADFSGYATKAGIKCTDGRTIMHDAFKGQDNEQVPLVWSHGHKDVENILGHAILEARGKDHPEGGGTYMYGYFNDTPKGQAAKKIVAHKDINSMSIWANELMEKLANGTKEVWHGAIKEVSLVLAGANKGAKIDQIRIAHGEFEDDEILEHEAIITMGLPLVHTLGDTNPVSLEEKPDLEKLAADIVEPADPTAEPEKLTVEAQPSSEETPASEPGDPSPSDDTVQHADDATTLQDIYDSWSDEEKNVVHYMIGAALESAASAEHSDITPEGSLTHQEGNTDMSNLFETHGSAAAAGRDNTKVLSHSEFMELMAPVKKGTSTFKEALAQLGHAKAEDGVLAHADTEYGIENIDLLFPDAKALSNQPEWISRRMEWVSEVLGGTKHSPFAKVKTIMADITADEARAKGYVKGTKKVEEVLKLLRRTTGPATIYKKQKLDRDDILDITDIDVVAWLKVEMRIMIEEEIARAILVGDGRNDLDPDKIKDPSGSIDGVGLRSILHDDALFSIKHELAANVAPKEAVKGIVRARTKYRGTGKPTLFISDTFLTDIMLEEDKFGRPLYETEQSLADKLRVSKIVTVDLFDDTENLFAIMVNLQDYTIGSNKGGELTSFQDFDIDFNQEKYLQETRLSGALTKPYSAIVITRALGTEVTGMVTAPSYNGDTHVITVPSKTGVVYTIDDEPVTGSVTITETTEVEARADEGFYIPAGQTRSWVYNF
jgi:hypothetical protein